jgi:Antitoxin MazE-like
VSEPIKRRVARHRERLRAAGLRPLQVWVPDTTRRGFAASARRQSRLLWRDVKDRKTLAWLSRIADTTGWK